MIPGHAILAFKNGVRLEKLQPQMTLACMVIAGVYGKWGLAECVVTSGSDGMHGGGDPTKTLHDDGLALDFRSKTIVSGKQQILEELRQRLGECYQVVLEHEGGPNEHFHVEYDPPPGLPVRSA